MLARLLALTTLMLALPAFACSCYVISTDVLRERAAAVFDGVVVAKRVILHNDPYLGYLAVNEYEFAAIRFWEGQPAPRVVLRGGVACASEFSAGRRYIVFASQDGGGLANMSCGATGRFDEYSKYGDVEQRFGVPLARFDGPAKLPGATAAAWYTQRANLIVGVSLLARLAEDRLYEEDGVRTASVGIALTGVAAAVFLLIAAATNFRRRKRALLLLVAAGIVAVAVIAAAGRVYLSYPAYSINMRWQHPQV